MAEPGAPFFSVVIPVRNGAAFLPACLRALRASTTGDWELWVVDDGSHDDSAEIARAAGAALLATAGGRGPAAARNLGARHARGDYLLFLDADCEVLPQTLAMAQARLLAEPDLAALFGSYDDDPPAPGFISQYKNLLHHFVHQNGAAAATTFWAGCCAVRRSTFLAAGGFDEQRWRRPAIEDIELGYRLCDGGARILLAREVQVKHLKRWTFATLLRTDFRDRALPWAGLLLERRIVSRNPAHDPATLNVDRAGRLSVAVAVAASSAIGLALFDRRWLWGSARAGLVLLLVNRRLYGFFLRRRGAWFALAAVAMHWLYLLYCAVAGVLAIASHWGRRQRRRPAPAEPA
jgi:glycosyltransferase involved in cell wall biosynthesis